MIVKLSTLLSIMDIVFTIVSMHQDMDAGRPTEVDMLSGVMRKLGQDLGVATPYNDMLYHMIKLKEQIRLLSKRYFRQFSSSTTRVHCPPHNLQFYFYAQAIRHRATFLYPSCLAFLCSRLP